MDVENNIFRTWIYSYLKYGGVATQEQRDRSKKKFKQYLIDNDEALREQNEEPEKVK